MTVTNSGNGVDKSGESGIILKENSEKLAEAKKNGTVSTRLDKQKQGAHIKGNPEYIKRINNGENPSYITVSKMEIQQIINTYSGTGEVHTTNGGFKEVIIAKSAFGVCVEKYTGREYQTNKGTIHYSKSGTHIVPAKPEEG